MDFFRILSQRNTKSWILRIRIRINPLNLHRVWIFWIHNPFLDFAKETKIPFLDSESRLGFFPKKCTPTVLFINWKFLPAVVYCNNYRVLGTNTVKWHNQKILWYYMKQRKGSLTADVKNTKEKIHLIINYYMYLIQQVSVSCERMTNLFERDQRTGGQVVRTSWCFKWMGDQVIRTSWFFPRTDANFFKQLTNSCKRNPIYEWKVIRERFPVLGHK